MRKHACMFSYPSRGCFCKQPTTRVLRRISRLSRSRMLFVRMLRRCWLGAPQELGDVLHATHGYACQVHLDERLLHGRFPASVALYDGCFDSAPDERFQVVLESGFVDFSGRDPLVEFAKENIRYPHKLL